MHERFSLTPNVIRVMDFLIRNFEERLSINTIGKRLGLSPRGAHQILKNLEKIDAIVPERIGNVIYYRPNWEGASGRKMMEFIMLRNDLSKYAQVQAEDLSPLKERTHAAVLFGSVLTKGKDAADIDVLLVYDRKNFGKVEKSLKEIRSLKAKPIHQVAQTPRDLEESIRKHDAVILNILRTGAVLWGPETLVEAIRHGANRQ